MHCQEWSHILDIAVVHDILCRREHIPAGCEQPHAEQRLQYTPYNLDHTLQPRQQAQRQTASVAVNAEQLACFQTNLPTSSPSNRNGSSGSKGTSSSTRPDPNMNPAAEPNEGM